MSPVAGRLAAFAAGCLVAVALAELASRIVMPTWPEFSSTNFMDVVEIEGEPPLMLGRPGYQGYFAENAGDFRVKITINDFGLRNDSPEMDAEGALWAVGDSFTFGWGVERDDAFGLIAAKILNTKGYLVASPGADVCNYRTLIRRMPVKPSAVVVGLVLENDILDYDCSPRPAHPDQGGFGLFGAKHWLMRNSALYNLAAVAVKRQPGILEVLSALGLIARPHELQFSTPDDQTIDSTVGALLRVRDVVPGDTPFAVLLIPTRLELLQHDAPSRTVRLKLADRLAARGIAVIDIFPELDRLGFSKVHFRHDGHWTPMGHSAAGAEVARWLKASWEGKARS